MPFFKKLWYSVPHGVFSLSLSEAFRGVLEFQGNSRVGQASGQSVSSLDQSQLLVLLSHLP